MEHAPLRPVPSRPAGPIDPATATREVAAALPALSGVEARALGLVLLAERPRAEVARSLGIEERQLGALLAGARKELRRTVAVLGGSGWCERAETLISDRLDGELAEADKGRLDAHLRNCPRCVEHERRLVQATDALMSGLAPAAPPRAQPPAPLEEVRDEPEPAGPEPAGPATDGAPAHTDEDTPEAATTEDTPAPPAADDASSPAPAPAPATADDVPAEDVTAAHTESVSEPPTGGEVAAAAEVLVAVRTRRQLAAALTWNALVVLAVLLALATIGFTIAGILGAEL
jgi:anti-sigma factor RsiW